MPAAPQSRPAAVFVTGGTGKVARQLAPLLAGPFASEPIPVLLGSRSGGTPDASRYAGVAFDWGNPSSWRPALAQLRELAAANSNKGDFYDDDDHTGPATAVFLIVPSIVEPGGMVSAFIDLAREKANARRFVLLSASLIEDGGPAMGQVHRGLRERGEKGEIEWAVLRPTWFQGMSFPSRAIAINYYRGYYLVLACDFPASWDLHHAGMSYTPHPNPCHRVSVPQQLRLRALGQNITG